MSANVTRCSFNAISPERPHSSHDKRKEAHHHEDFHASHALDLPLLRLSARRRTASLRVPDLRGLQDLVHGHPPAPGKGAARGARRLASQPRRTPHQARGDDRGPQARPPAPRCRTQSKPPRRCARTANASACGIWNEASAPRWGSAPKRGVQRCSSRPARTGQLALAPTAIKERRSTMPCARRRSTRREAPANRRRLLPSG